MKWTKAKIARRLALLGFAGLFASGAEAAESRCKTAENVKPAFTNAEQECRGSGQAKQACVQTHREILQKYNEYSTAVQAACRMCW